MAIGAETKPRPNTDAYDQAAQKALQEQGQPSGPGQPAWNSDTSPVVIARRPTRGPYSASVYMQPNETNVFDGRKMLSYWRAQRANGDDTYDYVVGLLRRKGYLGPRANSIDSIETAWKNVLTEGSKLFAQDPSAPGKADVFDYLNSLDDQYDPNADTKGSGPSGSGPSSNIDSTVTLTDPGTAQTLVDQALEQYLGRKANDKETATFRKALAAAQMANPQVTQSATSGGTNSTSSTLRSGGFNPQTFAEEWALGQKGAGEYQAATTFLDTFMGSLGNPMEVA